MRPFLLLATRAEDQAADDEYAAFLRFAGLPPEQLHRIRLEAGPLPDLDLDDYAGIFLGGSPFNSSDPPQVKSPVQQRVEADLARLLDEVVARDFPFFGACYGVGTIVSHQGGVVDRTYTEPLSAVSIELTAAGVEDPLLAGMPERFDAFVGHKEACLVLPPSAVLLATGEACPVQMFRVGQNVYGTQFHPELDPPGFCARARVYQHYGYFPPHELDALIDRLSQGLVTEPGRLLKNFVARYA